MPIFLADSNVKLTIRQITGSDKVKSHLQNLGFVPGEEIMVINKVDDNVIVKIKGISLGVSHELAKRILV